MHTDLHLLERAERTRDIAALLTSERDRRSALAHAEELELEGLRLAYRRRPAGR